MIHTKVGSGDKKNVLKRKEFEGEKNNHHQGFFRTIFLNDNDDDGADDSDDRDNDYHLNRVSKEKCFCISGKQQVEALTMIIDVDYIRQSNW